MNQIWSWLDPHTWGLLNIQWTDPHWWVWVLVATVLTLNFAAYNLKVLDVTRDYWGERLILNEFSPRTRKESISLWLQWVLILDLLVLCCFNPNLSTMPQTVEAGAVEWQNVFDVSNSQAAEDTRPFYGALTGEQDPGPLFQWGTRLDTNKALFKKYLLPQLNNNKAGLITVEGAGYNMWDITSDLSANGAFQHMLNKFVQTGAAPGSGCDYTSGIQAALDEFDLIASIEKKDGDTSVGGKTEKIRFIALWTDGGFTGDEKELNKVLDQLVERKIRLLIVDTAGDAPVTVPKYDPSTHKRNGEYYKGMTKSEPELIRRMVYRLKDLGTLILAPPGTKEIKYNIPQQAGGRYARPAHSNLKPCLLVAVLALFFSITTGGGGLPRLSFFLPAMRGETLSAALRSIKSRFAIGRSSKSSKSSKGPTS
jgi:hypothetical protein